jgi:hypothetical protein
MAATAASQPAALWPEADRLFHSDPRWLGSDAAYSVPLSPNRILWLFGDTFVARRRGQTRRQSGMARNTIGIQTGRNPATASIRFYWRPEGSGSFFPGESPNWLWPEHGIRTERGLLLFFMVVKPAGKSGPLAFRNDGWTAFLIPNPDAVPGPLAAASTRRSAESLAHHGRNRRRPGG